MNPEAIIFSVFLVFAGAAVLATLALYLRQSLLVAYIVVGGMLGPFGFGLIEDPALIRSMAEFGITFLLFLLGLHLQPQELLGMVRKTTLVTLISSLIFAALGFVVAYLFGFNLLEALIIGACLVFSSTIIGLKLLPTTVLHHQRMGELMISVLLLQDMIAIVLLLLLKGGGDQNLPIVDFLLLLLALPTLIAIAWGFERYVLIKLIRKFDKVTEYIFLMAIGWCLGVAELAHWMGLSAEAGAFIAGVTLASSPIARYIAEALKPLRDFFLVLFFVSLGAGFNVHVIDQVIVPAMVLTVLVIAVKPMVFRYLVHKIGEHEKKSREIGFRLGQMSEFSLLVAVLALEQNLISESASYLIQLSTLLTFLLSSYLVVFRFPTPIAVSDELRRD